MLDGGDILIAKMKAPGLSGGEGACSVMHNELTEMDLKKMREELDYRRITLRPKLLEEVKVARGFGDLSENFEYKAAKRDKNRCFLMFQL